MLTLITASASTGRSIYFPRGTYLFTSSVTIINNTRGFTIYGEGKETVIIGDLSSNSSMWWFQDASGITVENIYFDGDRRNGSLLARALSFSNPSDCQTNNCWFYDMQSPVFMYVDNSNLPDTNQIYRYNHIRDCFFDSNGNDGNGYLMVSLSYSSITGCTAINLRNDGGVNFALQLKNECYQCIISDCIVDTAYRGVVFGNDQINALGCQQCVVSNISIKNCFQGITLFATVNCIVKNCVIDMEGINQSQMAAISFLFNSINHPCRNNSVTGITIKNFLIATEAIIRLNQYSNDNLVVVDMLDDSTASLLLATFGFNTANNKVIFRKKTGGFETATISNSGTNNIVNYEDFVLTESTTAISTTVPIRAGNGTASAPSYSFTSTTNAGIYNALANTNNISVGGIGISSNGNERMRIGSTTLWRRHTSDSVNWAVERTLLSGGVLYNQLSDTTGNNNTFTPIVFAPLNSANELLAIYSDSVRSVNPFRSGNIQVTNGANIATIRNSATANTTITLPSTTGTLALTSQVPASEYFIGETTTAQSINNSTTTELTLNGFTTSGNVGGFSIFTDGNIKVPSTGIYLIKVNPAFASNATGYRVVSIQQNATTLLSEISQRAVDGTGTGMFTADVASLTAGDNIRIQVFQNSGGSLNLGTSRLSVNRIG